MKIRRPALPVTHRYAIPLLAVVVGSLAACGGDGAESPATPAAGSSVQPPPATSPAATIMQVKLAGWPGLSGLTVKADGLPVKTDNGTFSVNSASTLTLEVAGIELAAIKPKPVITLFDLQPERNCQSTPALGKLASLLLSLDSDQDPGNGISIPPLTASAAGVKLAALSEADLLALETRLVGRSMPVVAALRAVNSALDQETWSEVTAQRTSFVNDMSVLQQYLDRVLTQLALDAKTLTGFSYLTDEQAASIPATLKSQGLAFDGATPVFSWRYGLQRTDAGYAPALNRPLALPADIQAIYGASPGGPHMGHIGDIDIADGKLYAPIEDEDDSSQQSYIAVFDAKTLQYTGVKHALPLAEHADGVPWVAVDAPRKQFYTVTWSTAAADKLNVFDLETFKLIRSVPLQTSFNGKRVQGAKIYQGMLYASADTKDTVNGLKRKRIYKVDTVSGSVIELLTYDEPNRTEAEGLAFGPDGTMHLMVVAPYTTPLYAQTNNAKPFDESYSIDGDDWNPSATLRHFTRKAAPLRETLCGM
ncbi:hypothetical protein [Cupriavidus sp. USMAA2-4]|uniref:hypothetical protein n=1 Tax=Cupriavidus sp. USMAA2-4 TaxID=876364 RepID=UPI0012F48EEF|nr:hypothetical protein [Cupriavidus sp. USMAA2-4]